MGGRHVIGIERFSVGRGLSGKAASIVTGLASGIVEELAPGLPAS
jgi:hypothetical protein